MATDYAVLKKGGFMRQKQKNNFSLRLAKELDDRYFARELPHKFKFGITGCQNNCLKAEENDVGIIPFIEDHDKLMKVCDAAIVFFEENAKPGERFKFTIDRVGKDKLEKVVKEAYENG